jgi:hypothetical protein
MAIWEFTENTYEEIRDILFHCKALEELGIKQDEEMMAELNNELSERKLKNKE